MSIYIFTSFIHLSICWLTLIVGSIFLSTLTGKRDLVGKKICFCLKSLPCFWNSYFNQYLWRSLSCCKHGSVALVNVHSWFSEHGNARVSPYCAQRKCRENSLPGWSDLLIHPALLDLRLTVQLLPIKVETQKKRGSPERRRRPPSYTHLMESGGTSGGRKWDALNETSLTIPAGPQR